MIALGCAAAWAGSAVVTVAFSEDGHQVRSVVPVAGEVAPGGGDGALEILDVDGRVVARAPLEDPRIRSVAVPEGGGETAVLARAIGRYTIDWPAGAHRVRIDGRDTLPAGPPPARDGVVAVQYAGPASERLDLLILGDGYTEAELPRFAEDVDALVGYLGAIPPYGRYASLLNVWRTDTASVESGVTHLESGIARETAFGCYYGCGGIDRLVCCEDAAVVAAADAVGAVEGILVLVNDPVYGGSGGFTYATSYNGADGLQVAAHELGHSLVLLRDEYAYGLSDTRAFTGPNCSPTDVGASWAHWLGVDGVDAFAVCSYDNFWRPTEDGCMMRTLQDAYCPVCREAAVLALYQRIPGLVSTVSVAEGTTIDATGALAPILSVETLVPAELLTFEWSVDGVVVSDSGPEIAPRCRPDLAGALTLRVLDPTPWVREDPQDLLLATRGPWTVLADPCVVQEERAGCGCVGTGTAPLALAVLPLVGIRRRKSS